MDSNPKLILQVKSQVKLRVLSLIVIGIIEINSYETQGKLLTPAGIGFNEVNWKL